MSWSKACGVAVILMAVFSSSSAAYAAHGGKHSHTPPAPGTPAATVGTPAFKVYDAAIIQCMQTVVQVNPLEAAKSSDAQALDMDRDDIEGIQDCMKGKGIDVDFDKQYSARQNSSGPLLMDKALMEDLQEIEAQLNGAAPPPAVAPAPSASVPAMPPAVRVAPAPVPAAAQPVPAASAAAPVKAEDSEPAPPKKARQPRKYWVDTE